MKVCRSPNTAAVNLLRELQAGAYPIEQLCAYPVSALEGFGTDFNDTARPVCAVGCLACCAGALRPSEVRGHIALLTPDLLGRTLTVFHELSLRGRQVLSTGRLNLFSGSNELDHPFCPDLRDLLSAYLQEHYGFPLGHTSSDIAFHVSGSLTFQNNLLAVLSRPKTWDNICFSIDEQIPMSKQRDYERYLESLDWVWKALEPALRGSLSHAKPKRQGEPRVILNFLIPKAGDSFIPEFSQLYPGGPERATSFETLLERYVRPYVSELSLLKEPAPSGHYFTTGIGGLRALPSALVYVAESRYSLTGRADEFIQPGKSMPQVQFSAIRTKLVPVERYRVRIQARLTTTPVSEDELPSPSPLEPAWFEPLNRRVLELSDVDVWRPTA
jgi:hypothetical protein